jgi:hypothetical protein
LIRFQGPQIYSAAHVIAWKVFGMTTTTSTQVELEHPYQAAGIVAILLSFVTLAFTLGVLARCGHGSGICLTGTSHVAGDVGLAVFVLLFIVGVALLVYTGSGTVLTRTRTPTAPPVVTNVVVPSTAPAAPTPVTNVYPPAAAAAPATVVVSPR